MFNTTSVTSFASDPKTDRFSISIEFSSGTDRSANATRCFVVRRLLVVLLWCIIVLPTAGYPQSLDQAVSSQLAFDGNQPCSQLINGDSNPLYLKEPLYGICSRSRLSAGPVSSSATGGGAATAAGLPAIVEERLRSEKKTPESAAAKPEIVVELDGGLGLFFSGQFERLNRDITKFEDGYNSDIWRVTVGADYQFTKSLMGGLAFDGYNHHGSFDGGGHFNTNSYGFLAYGSYQPFERTYLQLSAGYARKLNDRVRIATFTDQYNTNISTTYSGPATTDYNANEARVSALGGYDFPISNFTIGPRVGLDFRHVDFGTYSENSQTGLALTFYDVKQTSLQSVLGFQGSAALSTDFGVIVPQVSFNWKHEFRDNQRREEVSFVDDTRSQRFTYLTDRPDRNFFEITAGVSAVLLHGVQPFVNYRALIGHSFFKSHAGTIGVRVTF